MSEKLECGHRNDMPHLIAVLAGKLLMGGLMAERFVGLPDGVRNALIDEFQESVASAFKHAGIPDNEIDGQLVFDAVKAERLAELEPLFEAAAKRAGEPLARLEELINELRSHSAPTTDV